MAKQTRVPYPFIRGLFEQSLSEIRQELSLALHKSNGLGQHIFCAICLSLMNVYCTADFVFNNQDGRLLSTSSEWGEPMSSLWAVENGLVNK